MLDTSQPGHERFLRAMELEHKLVRLSQALTISPISERTSLKEACDNQLQALLDLNASEFEQNPTTAAAIESFAAQLPSLVPICSCLEDKGADHCPMCGLAILSFEVGRNIPRISLCESCYKRLKGPLEDIRRGFGLDID